MELTYVGSVSFLPLMQSLSLKSTGDGDGDGDGVGDGDGDGDDVGPTQMHSSKSSESLTHVGSVKNSLQLLMDPSYVGSSVSFPVMQSLSFGGDGGDGGGRSWNLRQSLSGIGT